MQHTNKNSANDQVPWYYDTKFYRQNKTTNGCNYNDNSQNQRNDQNVQQRGTVNNVSTDQNELNFFEIAKAI